MKRPIVFNIEPVFEAILDALSKSMKKFLIAYSIEQKVTNSENYYKISMKE